MANADIRTAWTDILARFLKLGATAYGGPAIMGIMQAVLGVIRGRLAPVLGLRAVIQAAVLAKG